MLINSTEQKWYASLLEFGLTVASFLFQPLVLFALLCELMNARRALLPTRIVYVFAWKWCEHDAHIAIWNATAVNERAARDSKCETLVNINIWNINARIM